MSTTRKSTYALMTRDFTLSDVMGMSDAELARLDIVTRRDTSPWSMSEAEVLRMATLIDEQERAEQAY